MKKALGILLALLIGSLTAFADIAPIKTPEPKPSPKASPVSSLMYIKMDSGTKVATLSIPRDQLKSLRAQIDQLDDESVDTTAANGSFSRTPTIVSGAFLSLALVFGGLWFVRSGKATSRSGKAFGILVLVGMIGSGATFVYANIGPPPGLRTISSKLFDKKAFGYWTSASGKVDVVVSDAQAIELKVPAPKDWPNDKEGNKSEE